MTATQTIFLQPLTLIYALKALCHFTKTILNQHQFHLTVQQKTQESL